MQSLYWINVWCSEKSLEVFVITIVRMNLKIKREFQNEYCVDQRNNAKRHKEVVCYTLKEASSK